MILTQSIIIVKYFSLLFLGLSFFNLYKEDLSIQKKYSFAEEIIHHRKWRGIGLGSYLIFIVTYFLS